MKNNKHIIASGNQAAAYIAYKVNEVCALYPITPSSEMSELVEEWSADNKENIFGNVPTTFEMQSESGVAGALHGALQTGSLATTFTASQGLLLMMPNMFKIAGELAPNVIHVATRSVATHALSVFGDHSDIMAVRNTGYAFLGAASVQEAMDFSLISQASTLKSRIPFVHFFDGFRTSHEVSKIEVVTDTVISNMIDIDLVNAHHKRALDPNNPVLRGTAQRADTFFQSREAVNTYYDNCPNIVQEQMDIFAELTGRQYQLFEYVGHPEAEEVIIAMASATETIEETVKYLNGNGEKIGLIKVRLFRPFSTKHLVNAIPDTCKAIAVLDRTKEPGSTGEPLYLDVVQTIMQNAGNSRLRTLPKVIGGRYGLSSKEFTPNMVKAVIDNLKHENSKNNFTIGITDDVTHLSLPYSDKVVIKKDVECLLYESVTKTSKKSTSALSNILGTEHFEFLQQYNECDYNKSKPQIITNLRLGREPIKAPYLIARADFVACDSIIELSNNKVISRLKTNGTLLVNSNDLPKDFLNQIPLVIQEEIRQKNISVYSIDLKSLPETYRIGASEISAFHVCFLVLSNAIVVKENVEDVVAKIKRINISEFIQNRDDSRHVTTKFEKSFLGKLISGNGDEISVGQFPVDGSYPTNTSIYNPPRFSLAIPEWDENACTQCGACSLACPQGAIRIKAFDDSYLEATPTAFKSIKFQETDWEVDLLNYTVQVNPEQCTDCNNCVDACPAKALAMTSQPIKIQTETDNWNHFDTISEFDRTKIDITKLSEQQLQEPLFKYSYGVDGCGEGPYLKLVSQLFGDRMLIANATGASSIFGGALPTTPWSKNNEGRGPAWSNSLFEDNAEFGLGYRLSLDYQEEQAKTYLKKLRNQLGFDWCRELINADQSTERGICEQRERVGVLKAKLKKMDVPAAKQLLKIADSLVKKSVWIVGGDGWAYDIGYGGLDHVMASGKNVNILVLDNEVYSNTGGQMSKATPFGASAKFAIKGKQKQKKDLGLLAMAYEDVYVGSVAIGADQEQTLKTFVEAESYDGPSIIIAYCHSPSHGIDMKNPSKYHRAAVASGQWLLYRNDPRRMVAGLNTLQLDSKEPSIPIEEYLRMEERFKQLFKNDSNAFNELMFGYQEHVDKRFDKYWEMAATIAKPWAEFA